MSYLCRIYLNSGYNASNIPDSPARLAGVTYVDVPALDIMQDRGLSEIRVKVSGWDAIKNADYMYLSNTATNPVTYWYYTIEDIKMVAMDVASLTVTPDYITSVGGVGALSFLDGITERVHVASDNYGEHCLDDPLLTPTQPLQIVTQWIGYNTSKKVYAECRLDPILSIASGEGKNYTHTDPITQETLNVVVPQAEDIAIFTDFFLGTDSTENAKTLVFILTDETASDGQGGQVQNNSTESFMAGMAVLRSLGLENAIIAQAEIPSDFVTPTYAVVANLAGDGYTATRCTRLTANFDVKTASIPYVLDGQAKNNRINYSHFTKFGILTASGESCEYNPEEIVETGQTYPHIRAVGDPRLDGKPYFRFKSVNGDDSEAGFFKNCVSGLHWKSVPLVFTAPSGTALNTLRYQNSYMRETVSFADTAEKTMMQAVGNHFNALASLVQGAGNPAGVNPGELAGGFLNTAGMMLSWKNTETMHKINQRSALDELAIANEVQIPQVFFPFNSEIIRDFKGNGIMVYRYEYTASDRARIDKLLTMYGYRVEKALEATDFTNRQYFNFVKAGNVTVTGFARWLNDAIGEQLRAGVRVWHTAPSATHYLDNPIATP